MPRFVKQRPLAAPGSIPAVLRMFENEMRFYQEIAPVVDVRVPACYLATADADGTRLELEDLSEWSEGASPLAAAILLAHLHGRWQGMATARWPWLRRAGEGVDLVAALYDGTWPRLRGRSDLTPSVREWGEHLLGHVPSAQRAASAAGPVTLAHGDASYRNMRTGPGGAVALLDWEDVSAAPGATDLAWLLVSSVRPDDWDVAVTAYGSDAGLADVMPSAVVQALLSLADEPVGSAQARAWVRRIEAAAERAPVGNVGA
ncbi:MAG: phosphotransferase [Mycobacteriales bacterium]